MIMDECRGLIDPTVDIESHNVVGAVDVAVCRQRLINWGRVKGIKG